MAVGMLSRIAIKLRPKTRKADSYEHFGLDRVADQLREYEHFGEDRVLEASIADCERALALILPNVFDDPSQAQKWSVHMAACLRLRFERDGVPKDIEDAQQMLESIISATEQGDPVHTKAIYGLGRVFETLHHYTGLQEYVGQAHDCFGRTLDGLEMLKEEDTVMELELLVALAWCLNSIPARKANAEALRLCSAVLQEAIDTDYAYLLALHGLSCASFTRWEMNGRQDKTDLINAQDYARRAIQTPHRLQFRHLRWVATICRERADAGDDVAYIDEAIQRSAEAVEIIKERHAPASHDVGTILITLGLAYHSRYKALTQPEDLDNAINLHRRALATIPFTPFSARHTLIDCLCDRYHVLGLPKDIEDAFETAKHALSDAPNDSTDKLLSLANVGRTLALRYSHGKENRDFLAAGSALREAVQIFHVSEGYPPSLLVFILELLAKIHDIHYQVRRLGEDADLSVRYMEEAIATKKAYALLPDNPSPRSSTGSADSSGSDSPVAVGFPASEIYVTVSRETQSDSSSDFKAKLELAPVRNSITNLVVPS